MAFWRLHCSTTGDTTCSAGAKFFGRLWKTVYDHVCSDSAIISLIARIHRARKQKVEMKVVLPTVTPSDSPIKMFAFYFHDCMLCWPRDLSCKRKNASSRGHNNDSIQLESKMLPGQFGFLMRLNQQAKKGVTVLAVVIDWLLRKNWTTSKQWR